MSSSELVEHLWRDLRLREEVAERSTVPELPVHEHLAHQEALRYLNVHWEGVRPTVVHVRGGRMRKRAKEGLARFVLGLFAEYLDAEREYRAHSVRVSNSFATGHDKLAHEIRAVAEAIRTESRRLTDEDEFRHRLLEERVAALEHLVSQLPR